MAEQSIESLSDDGTGQIRCPLKQGVIAIQRCHEYQAESAARGQSCGSWCAAFAVYSGGAPPAAVNPVIPVARVIERAPTKEDPMASHARSAVARACSRCKSPPPRRDASPLGRLQAVPSRGGHRLGQAHAA